MVGVVLYSKITSHPILPEHEWTSCSQCWWEHIKGWNRKQPVEQCRVTCRAHSLTRISSRLFLRLLLILTSSSLAGPRNSKPVNECFCFSLHGPCHTALPGEGGRRLKVSYRLWCTRSVLCFLQLKIGKKKIRAYLELDWSVGGQKVK